MKTFNLAVKELRKGNYQKAKTLLERVLAKNPDDSKALTDLGIVFKNLGMRDQALEAYQKAIESDPKNSAAHNNLGNILLSQGKTTLARHHFLKAITLKKDYAEACGNLGVLCQTKEDFPQALKYYKKAISISPDLIDHLSNLSTILEKRGSLTEAESLARQSLKYDPNNASTYNNLGNVLRDEGKLEEARSSYQKAIKLNARLAEAYSNLTELSYRLCLWDEGERLHKKQDEMGAETPFLALRLHRDLKHHQAIAKAWSDEIYAAALRSNMQLGYWLRKKNDKIRVGYLSANFCNHPVGQVVAPIFRLHDRKSFQVFAYSYGPNDKSQIRKEIKKSADVFRDFASLSDAKAAKIINKDRVDILVDLTGHTRGGRMGILAHHPSPFQISWLGFPGTSGASFMEYMIVDKVIVPKSEAKYYSEKLIYMPGCYQINNFALNKENDNIRKILDGKFSKKDFGVSDDTFVFASFNKPYKIDQSIFSAWMKILSKVPKSVLVLWGENEIAVKNLTKLAKKEEVDPKRLIFVKDLPLEKHLARLAVCDLALDTRYYSGGATTANALLANVPVITLKGTNYITRMSESHLKALGIKSLITGLIGEYVNLAVSLAKNPTKLEKIKQTLVKRLKASSLFDAPAYVKNLEAEYTKIVISKTQE